MQSPSRGQPGIISCIDQDEDDRSVDFTAQDDAFLDSVSEMLQRLADECGKALEWSSESEAIVGDAREAFESIANMCRHAGLIVTNTEELNIFKTSDDDAQPLVVVVPDTSLAIEVPSPCYSDAKQYSPSHTPVPEIELEAPKASSLCPASPLAAASPAKSSMDRDFELLHSDLYSEGRDDSIGSSPGFRSTSSSVADSGRSGDCNGASIRSRKRKLTSSDLSTSHTSNCRHRSHSVASSSHSGGVSSGVKLQLKLEPQSERSSASTASFRRYYLSSRQQLSASNNGNSSSVSRIAPLS